MALATYSRKYTACVQWQVHHHTIKSRVISSGPGVGSQQSSLPYHPPPLSHRAGCTGHERRTGNPEKHLECWRRRCWVTLRTPINHSTIQQSRYATWKVGSALRLEGGQDDFYSQKKKKGKSKTKEHRLISLTAVYAKTIEPIVNQRLQWHWK